MKKKYEKATVEIFNFIVEDIVTASGIGLNYGGETGNPKKESFNSLFGN